jgi:hypothetical protein
MQHGEAYHPREIDEKSLAGKLQNMRTYSLPLIALAVALAGAAVIVIYI